MKNIKLEIKWAFIFIAVMLLWMVGERVSGLHDEHIDKHAIFTNLFAIPAILIFVFALLDKRKNFYNGVMTYGQGFLTGFIITIIVTLFTPLIQYIISTVISPDYFSNITEHVVQTGTMTREAAEKNFNLNSYIIQATVGAFIMGVITSAIVAIFTRKKAL